MGQTWVIPALLLPEGSGLFNLPLRFGFLTCMVELQLSACRTVTRVPGNVKLTVLEHRDYLTTVQLRSRNTGKTSRIRQYLKSVKSYVQPQACEEFTRADRAGPIKAGSF